MLNRFSKTNPKNIDRKEHINIVKNSLQLICSESSKCPVLHDKTSQIFQSMTNTDNFQFFKNVGKTEVLKNVINSNLVFMRNILNIKNSKISKDEILKEEKTSKKDKSLKEKILHSIKRLESLPQLHHTKQLSELTNKTEIYKKCSLTVETALLKGSLILINYKIISQKCKNFPTFPFYSVILKKSNFFKLN